MNNAARAETACGRSGLFSRRLLAQLTAGAFICLFGWSCSGQSPPGPPPAPPADVLSITAAAPLQGGPYNGRLLFLFITSADKRLSMRSPLDGPFLENPQPIASIAVENWDGRAPIEVTDSIENIFKGPLDSFHGPVRVQALLHVNDDRPRQIAGPGCLYSGVVSYEARSNAVDHVDIVLENKINDPGESAGRPNLKWFEIQSDVIDSEPVRPMRQRAAVVLPADYDDKPDALWPVVYIIPDRLEDTLAVAMEWADTLLIPNIEDVAPHAVHVILDPQTAHGHHGFVDSAFHGKRATNLVNEFIPQLEKEFRLSPRKEARILNGSGLGGWSAMWLQLNYPDTFGGCWVSAPTPIGFKFFQTIALYDEYSAFHDDTMQLSYAYRRTGMKMDEMIPSMTVEQMSQMERAIDPHGRSGGLYDTLNGMYSPVDFVTGRPRPMFDPTTGAFNFEVIEHWKQYDIERLVLNDWPRYQTMLRERVHLSAADLDSYYFDIAVRHFIDEIKNLPGGGDVAESIRIVEGATHENLLRHIFTKWNDEMREYFNQTGVDVQ